MSCVNKQDDNNFTVQEGYYRHKQIYSLSRQRLYELLKKYINYYMYILPNTECCRKLVYEFEEFFIILIHFDSVT